MTLSNLLNEQGNWKAARGLLPAMYHWYKKSSRKHPFKFFSCHLMCPTGIDLTIKTITRLHPSRWYTFYILLQPGHLKSRWVIFSWNIMKRLAKLLSNWSITNGKEEKNTVRLSFDFIFSWIWNHDMANLEKPG